MGKLEARALNRQINQRADNSVKAGKNDREKDFYDDGKAFYHHKGKKNRHGRKVYDDDRKKNHH
jgi:hypothetical protein